MRAKRILAAATLFVAAGIAGGSGAQERSADGPAETPPASYEGRQYVDSRGCVYVRAGIDGDVDWVPRMSRSREPVCDAEPTFPGGGGVPAGTATTVDPDPITVDGTSRPEARPAAPAPEPRETAMTEPRSAPSATAPVSRPEPVRASREVAHTPPSKPATAPAPRVVHTAPAVAARRRAPAPRAVVLASDQPACGAGTVTHYTSGGQRYAVRCRDRVEAPGVVLRGDGVPSRYAYQVKVDRDRHPVPSPYTRIVPRHVYEKRDDQVTRIPPGYRPAWKDGRLNRNRANMSLGGYRESQFTWTHTVPRELVPRGRYVKVDEPTLIYP